MILKRLLYKSKFPNQNLKKIYLGKICVFQLENSHSFKSLVFCGEMKTLTKMINTYSHQRMKTKAMVMSCLVAVAVVIR